MSSNARAEARAAATLLLAAVLGACAAGTRTAAPPPAPATAVGPERGTLVVAGGGRLDADVMDRFIELAGGTAARIVVIPSAGTEEQFGDDWVGARMFRDAGVQSTVVLHTRDPRVADTEQFTEPLRSATGVWIAGGRQWRLADAYLGTRTLQELHAALARGAVIGGTSAGASIQGSYMVRGAVEGNTIMMAPGYEEGFGFLRSAAIDQHLLARGRENDMLEVVASRPHLLGIGIDEGTAIVVHGDQAEVIGRGAVAFYNAADAGDASYYFLRAGGVFDLRRRQTVRGVRVPLQSVRAEIEVIAVMNRLFAAMRAQDTAVIRELAHPDVRIFVPGETNGTPAVRVSTLSEFMDVIAASTERLDETAFEPEVRIDGNLASIWTHYEFLRGDAFSHCGTDAFHFARLPDGWRIIGLAYTTRREGCRSGQEPPPAARIEDPVAESEPGSLPRRPAPPRRAGAAELGSPAQRAVRSSPPSRRVPAFDTRGDGTAVHVLTRERNEDGQPYRTLRDESRQLLDRAVRGQRTPDDEELH